MLLSMALVLIVSSYRPLSRRHLARVGQVADVNVAFELLGRSRRILRGETGGSASRDALARTSCSCELAARSSLPA